MTKEQPTMVERVARAMQADAGHPADELYWSTPWTGAVVWRSLATAAINAMREPTEAMVEAGKIVDIKALRGAANIWQAMIDAAQMKEPGK